jgi:cell division protein FtsL
MHRYLLISLLSVLVVSSALGVVYAKHQNRKLFVELNALMQTRDAMDIEWGQLQLEQSTWSTHARIETAARTQLNMTQLDMSQIVVLKP